MGGFDDLRELLQSHLEDPSCRFAIGAPGATTEVSRDPDETLEIEDPAARD